MFDWVVKDANSRGESYQKKKVLLVFCVSGFVTLAHKVEQLTSQRMPATTGVVNFSGM